jgi:DNA invertase Pin-like site-specific DNA recombinase
MIYGYARKSTHEQDVTIQIEALKKYGCEIVRTEQGSGSSMAGRKELTTLLEYMREGDTLVVTRIDRLARSMRDLQNIVHDLKQRGIHLQATEQPINTSTSAGKAFLDMLGVFAEFETNLRRERQMEGISKAIERGVYKNRNRKATIDAMRVRRMKQEGHNVAVIARTLGCSRMSVYRHLNETSEPLKKDIPEVVPPHSPPPLRSAV